jgi:hypothetical protein
MTTETTPPPAPAPRDRMLALAGLALLLLAAAVWNTSWHVTHRAPVLAGHDPTAAIEQLQEFEAAPLFHVKRLLGARGGPSHSIYNLSTYLGLRALGPSWQGFVAVSTLYYFGLILAVFGLGWVLGSPRAALVAALLAAWTPAAFSWSRLFGPNIALMAVGAGGIYLMALTDSWRRILPAAAFGALAAVSIRMGDTVGDNFQFWPVFGVAALYAALVRFAFVREQKKRAALAIAAAALAFYLALNIQYITAAFGYIGDESAAMMVDTARQGRGAAGGWLAYPQVFWKVHLGPALSVATVLAALTLLLRPDRRAALALTTFLGGVLVFTVIEKKNYNYMFVLVPLAPVLIALALEKVPPKWLRNLLTGGVLAAALFGFFTLSFIDRPVVAPNQGLEPGLRALDAGHTEHLNFYPPTSHRHAPSQIAGAALTIAGRRPGTSLLLVGDLQDRQLELFRTVLLLVNRHHTLAVYDLAGELHYAAFPGRKMDVDLDDPQPIHPDIVVAFSSAARFLTPESCDAKAMVTDPAQAEETMDLYGNDRRLAVAEAWCTAMSEIDWSAYRRREFSFVTGDPQGRSGRVALYDRPEDGVDLRIDAPVELPNNR